MIPRLQVDVDHLARTLTEVNQFGRLPGGGLQRLAWTEPEVAARSWLLDRCRSEGLEAEQDQAGNIWAWGGQQPAIVMGSHLDTVPNGGAFDGALGVIAALEILSAARRAGIPHSDRLALVCFTDEEGVRFSTGMTGSRSVAGTLACTELKAATTADGHRLWDVLSEQGLDPAHVPDAAERRPAIAAYLELHIEQRPFLHDFRPLSRRNESLSTRTLHRAGLRQRPDSSRHDRPYWPSMASAVSIWVMTTTLSSASLA